MQLNEGGGPTPLGVPKPRICQHQHQGEQQDRALRPRELESQKSPVLGERRKALAEEKRCLGRAVEISGDEVDEQAMDGLGPWDPLRLPAPLRRAANGESRPPEGFSLGGGPPGQLGAGAEFAKPQRGTGAAPRDAARPGGAELMSPPLCPRAASEP